MVNDPNVAPEELAEIQAPTLVIDAFSKYYQVFAIDTRGHGKTPRGTAPFTIRQFAEDLLGFLDAHQIEKAHLLGFSDGGNIAMVFALRHPERVDRLILNGANLNAGGVKGKAANGSGSKVDPGRRIL